jgi:hypothetical protein
VALPVPTCRPSLRYKERVSCRHTDIPRTMYRIPDLVRDSKLDTRFHSGYTSHVYYESGPTALERVIPREEHWKRVKNIGRGAYGNVWLEQCVKGQAHVEWRAVKQISKPRQPVKLMNYNRELEAIAKFSHQKVSTSIRIDSRYSSNF